MIVLLNPSFKKYSDYDLGVRHSFGDITGLEHVV